MRIRPDSIKDPDTGEITRADGGRLGRFSQAFHRLWWGFFETPQLDAPETAVTDIRDVKAESGTDVSGLVAERVEGRVVSMAQYRMEQDAREEASQAHSLGPSPIDPDKLV